MNLPAWKELDSDAELVQSFGHTFGERDAFPSEDAGFNVPEAFGGWDNEN